MGEEETPQPNLPDSGLSSSPQHELEELPNGRENESGKRACWVCFATDEDEPTAEWVHPCKCRGTTKWVHQECIQRWVDEKKKDNPTGKVACLQCNTQYIIVFPDTGPLVIALEDIDDIINKTGPFLATGMIIGTVYWTSVAYGAVTVMQVVGHEKGMKAMEQADPFLLLVGLPIIPLVLISAKLVNWEDPVLYFLRRHSYKVPVLRHVLPAAPVEEQQSSTFDFPPMTNPASVIQGFCGALLLPTTATLVGKLMFDCVESNLHRTLLGGAAFLAIKGMLRLFHKQKQFVRKRQRKILNAISFSEASKNHINLSNLQSPDNGRI